MDDAELVRATRTGDHAAFTAIFDRHSARVHDLALAMLRDRALALDVVEQTFLEASLRLHGLEEEHRLGVWLLAITRRNGALRAGPTAGPDRQPALPNDDPERVHLASLVWEAVADLPLRDRTLLDLDLRQGLDGHDLADALGVTINQAQDLQARMRDRIEKGLSGYLIARTADGRCPDLTKVLKGWDGRFTPKDSRRIADHVDACRICNQTRFALPSPFALYAAGLPAPFPAVVRARVIDRVVLPASPSTGVGLPGAVTAAPVPEQAFSPTSAYQTPMPAARPHEDPNAGFPGSPAVPAPYPDPSPAPYPDPSPAPYPDPNPAPYPDPNPAYPAPAAYPDPAAAYPDPVPYQDQVPAYPDPASYQDQTPGYPDPTPYQDQAAAYQGPAPEPLPDAVAADPEPDPYPETGTGYADPTPAAHPDTGTGYADPAPSYPDAGTGDADRAPHPDPAAGSPQPEPHPDATAAYPTPAATGDADPVASPDAFAAGGHEGATSPEPGPRADAPSYLKPASYGASSYLEQAQQPQPDAPAHDDAAPASYDDPASVPPDVPSGAPSGGPAQDSGSDEPAAVPMGQAAPGDRPGSEAGSPEDPEPPSHPPTYPPDPPSLRPQEMP